MNKGQQIIAKAKEQLISFIVFETPLLYKKFGWEFPEDEDNFVIPTGDLEPIFINAEMDNSYLDVEDRCYEDIELAEVIVSPEGEVWVTNEDGFEWTSDEISVEELAHIADAMERAYKGK